MGEFGNPQHSWKCKLAMIGDTDVGKTSICRRYVHNEFSPSFIATIGIDFFLKNIKVNDHSITLRIWDTAGQERFRSLTTPHYRGAKGVVVVYDVCNYDSYKHIHMWLRNIEKWADENVIGMLIGNKTDQTQRREVTKEQGENISKKHKMLFMETSAKNGTNIQQAFQMLMEEIVSKNDDLIRSHYEDNSNNFYENIEVNENHNTVHKKERNCCR